MWTVETVVDSINISIDFAVDCFSRYIYIYNLNTYICNQMSSYVLFHYLVLLSSALGLSRGICIIEINDIIIIIIIIIIIHSGYILYLTCFTFQLNQVAKCMKYFI